METLLLGFLEISEITRPQLLQMTSPDSWSVITSLLLHAEHVMLFVSLRIPSHALYLLRASNGDSRDAFQAGNIPAA